MIRTLGRRAILAAIATGFGSISGCLEGPTFPNADVVAGPDGRFVFDPAELTVTVGETVTWGFASSGHNICCRPAHSDEVELPDDAEPFTSYDPDESPQQSVVPQGEIYEHTFEVAGKFVYVCIPHVTQGMIGTIHVG